MFHELPRADEILGLASAFFPGRSSTLVKAMRRLINEHRDALGVGPIRKLLQIAPSGYQRLSACRRCPPRELRPSPARRLAGASDRVCGAGLHGPNRVSAIATLGTTGGAQHPWSGCCSDAGVRGAVARTTTSSSEAGLSAVHGLAADPLGTIDLVLGAGRCPHLEVAAVALPNCRHCLLPCAGSCVGDS